MIDSVQKQENEKQTEMHRKTLNINEFSVRVKEIDKNLSKRPNLFAWKIKY